MIELFDRGLLAVILTAIAAFVAVGLIRRSRTFTLVGVAMLSWLVVLKYLLPNVMPASWRSVLWFGLTVALLGFMWVAIIQQPARLARRLGFIRRSPEWEYDVILAGLIDDFNEKIAVARGLDEAARRRGGRPAEAERATVQSEARRILERLRSVAPPTSGWADLVNEYLQLLELHMEHLGSPISEELEHRFQNLNATATLHREQLRSSYRANASSLFRWP